MEVTRGEGEMGWALAKSRMLCVKLGSIGDEVGGPVKMRKNTQLLK